ncbi:MAG: hypothetical protein QXI90_04335 [Thermofilum sp.]
MEEREEKRELEAAQLAYSSGTLLASRKTPLAPFPYRRRRG